MEDLNKQLADAFELFDQGQISAAEKIYTHCLEKVDRQSVAYLKVLHGLGYIKAEQAQYNEARKIYTEIRERTVAKGNSKEEHIAVHQLGMVERMAGNYEAALALFTEEFVLLNNENPDFAAGYAANFYEKGYIFLQQGQLNNAEEFLIQSLDCANRANDSISRGCSLRGLGELYSAKNKPSRAAAYFVQAIKAFKDGNDPIAVEEVFSLMEVCLKGR